MIQPVLRAQEELGNDPGHFGKLYSRVFRFFQIFEKSDVDFDSKTRKSGFILILLVLRAQEELGNDPGHFGKLYSRFFRFFHNFEKSDVDFDSKTGFI